VTYKSEIMSMHQSQNLLTYKSRFLGETLVHKTPNNASPFESHCC